MPDKAQKAPKKAEAPAKPEAAAVQMPKKGPLAAIAIIIVLVALLFFILKF